MIARLFALGLVAAPVQADAPVVLLQSTTSTQNAGLFDVMLPLAEAELGLDIRVVAVGTGQALQNAARCDGDLAIVHARAAEDAFVAQGYGTARYDLMYNDFVLVGPATDPADVSGAANVREAFTAIARAEAAFASRGDDSGTHQAEVALWTGIADVAAVSGTWYRETGSGMGATLNLAVGMGAYTLSDRATWLTFANPGQHRIVFDGDPALHNPYGVIPVSPAHCPNVNSAGARALVDWLLSASGQAAISGHRIEGQQLFYPGAAP